MKEFPKLYTERLVLREITQDDLEAIFMIFSNPDVLTYYGMDPIKSKEEVGDLIQKYRVGFEHGTVYRWAIVREEDNAFLGTCGYHNWHHRYFRSEIGYELSPDYWGMGYMQEAARAILDYGYSELGMHRIGALISPQNKSSIRLVERLGFKNEGLLKDYAYSGGNYHDLSMYAKIKQD
ncbi:GNAT family N-acetyltransferase [Alkalihalobacillus sp. AL-G]|uniref:GNAT family N-acetyltransferase n=1 Tax=Alkalihalobacillus sp. AL-G TaxID=2926399 RepID=UPI00272A7B2F|nr:GNAT family N-acetyltransferase [Alkalihalobacillus sp. AL-G]WLD92744.1 GNAT family N-acetyltransferase [Alkalihalobacillus sp. AL-G]